MAEADELDSVEHAAGSPRLSRGQYVLLLAQLDREAAMGMKPPVNRRHQQRIPFHQHARLSLEGRGEAAPLTIAARCRNISQRGLAFLHGAAIAAGTRCEIALLAPGEEPVLISGQIVRGRRLRRGVYEIGLRFDSGLDLSQLARMNRVDRGGASLPLPAARRPAV